MKRLLEPTEDGNAQVRMSDGDPIKLFLDVLCPECQMRMGDHTACDYFDRMTLTELCEHGYACRVSKYVN